MDTLGAAAASQQVEDAPWSRTSTRVASANNVPVVVVPQSYTLLESAFRTNHNDDDNDNVNNDNPLLTAAAAVAAMATTTSSETPTTTTSCVVPMSSSSSSQPPSLSQSSSQPVPLPLQSSLVVQQPRHHQPQHQQQPRQQPPQPRLLRRGKWTVEEQAYVARLIRDFQWGYLRDTPPGTTLRTYLSEQLGCDPMRITKKFTGEACIGKRVFHPATNATTSTSKNSGDQQQEATALLAATLDQAHKELQELKQQWLRRMELQQSESAQKAAAAAVAAVASTHSPNAHGGDEADPRIMGGTTHPATITTMVHDVCRCCTSRNTNPHTRQPHAEDNMADATHHGVRQSAYCPQCGGAIVKESVAPSPAPPSSAAMMLVQAAGWLERAKTSLQEMDGRHHPLSRDAVGDVAHDEHDDENDDDDDNDDDLGKNAQRERWCDNENEEDSAVPLHRLTRDEVVQQMQQVQQLLQEGPTQTSAAQRLPVGVGATTAATTSTTTTTTTTRTRISTSTRTPRAGIPTNVEFITNESGSDQDNNHHHNNSNKRLRSEEAEDAQALVNFLKTVQSVAAASGASPSSSLGQDDDDNNNNKEERRRRRQRRQPQHSSRTTTRRTTTAGRGRTKTTTTTTTA
ncbi:hypothetical protein ACA910_001598 [Epithemia clementina (nom. ined.)]